LFESVEIHFNSKKMIQLNGANIIFRLWVDPLNLKKILKFFKSIFRTSALLCQYAVQKDHFTDIKSTK